MNIKALISILILVCLCWWLACDSLDFMDKTNAIGHENKVIVAGYLNNISSFILFGFFIPFVLLGLLYLITGLRFDSVGYKIGLVCASIIGLWGWALDSELRDNLQQFNYVECTYERQLSLKYSSRTYVLPPETCESIVID